MMKRTLKKSLKWIIILGIISTAGYLGYTKFFKGKEAAELPPETMQVISFPVTEETLTSSIQVKEDRNTSRRRWCMHRLPLR